jgi:hypothetical protein
MEIPKSQCLAKKNHLRNLQSYDASIHTLLIFQDLLSILGKDCLIRPAIKDQLKRNGIPESHSNAVKEFVIQRPVGGAFTNKFSWGDSSEISLKLTDVFDGSNQFQQQEGCLPGSSGYCGATSFSHAKSLHFRINTSLSSKL